MAERDQDFDLAQLDQQIEHPTGFLDAPARRLVEDLQQMYQTPPADQRANAESLQRVQRRLRASLASRYRETKAELPGASQGHEERHLSMKQETSERMPRSRRLSRTLSVFAAAALLVALVGGLVAGLVLVHHRGPHTAGSSTPTSTAIWTPPPVPRLIFSDIEMKDAANGWARMPVTNSDGTPVTYIFHTSDGGLHWQNVTPPFPVSAALANSAPFHPLSGGTTPLSEDFLTNSVAWALRLPNHIFITTNGGRTWQSETAPAGEIQEVTFLDAQHGWIITKDAGVMVVFQTNNGGATWTRIQQSGSVFPLDSELVGMRFVNVTTGWAIYLDPSAAYTQGFVVTHDSGATWQPQRLPSPAGGTTVSGFSLPVFFNAQDGMLVGGYYGGYTGNESKLREQINTRSASAPPSAEAIYVTHDGGITWEGPNIQLNMLGLGSPDFIDTQHGWAIQTSSSGPNTSMSTLLTTSDSGQHWITVPTSANFTQSMPGSLNFVSSQIGWAVDFNSGGSILLKTEDGGQTWTQVNAIISN